MEPKRSKIIKKYRKLIEVLEQLVRDTEWWNANRNDCEPFDVGADKCALFAARKTLECFEKEDFAECSRWNEKLTEALDNKIRSDN